MYSEEIESTLLGMSLTALGEVPRSVSRFWRVVLILVRTSAYSPLFKYPVSKVAVDRMGALFDCLVNFFILE